MTEKRYNGAKVFTGAKAKIMIDGKEIGAATEVELRTAAPKYFEDKTKFILIEGEIVPATLEELR